MVEEKKYAEFECPILNTDYVRDLETELINGKKSSNQIYLRSPGFKVQVFQRSPNLENNQTSCCYNNQILETENEPICSLTGEPCLYNKVNF